MMYLHIGGGVTVRKKDVIGIFDLDSATVSKITRKYISYNQKKGNIKYEDSDLPRAFVLYEDEGECKIRLSRISPTGLNKRFTEDIEE